MAPRRGPPQVLRAGQVYRFDMQEASGDEGKARPCVIVQMSNPTALSTVVIVPLTTNLRNRKRPTNVYLNNKENGLETSSLAVCHLISALDKSTIASELETTLSEAAMLRVRHTLALLLGIDIESAFGWDEEA